MIFGQVAARIIEHNPGASFSAGFWVLVMESLGLRNGLNGLEIERVDQSHSEGFKFRDRRIRDWKFVGSGFNIAFGEAFASKPIGVHTGRHHFESFVKSLKLRLVCIVSLVIPVLVLEVRLGGAHSFSSTLMFTSLVPAQGRAILGLFWAFIEP